MASRASEKTAIPILRSDEAGFEAAFRRLESRRVAYDDAIEKTVRKIVERVRDGGEKELLALVRKLDSAKVGRLEVLRDEWDAGVEKLLRSIA